MSPKWLGVISPATQPAAARPKTGRRLAGAGSGPPRIRWRVRGMTEQRVQVKPGRFRVPDLCVVLDRHRVEQVVRRPPALCVEILSKDDSMSEMQERAARTPTRPRACTRSAKTKI